MTKLNQNFRVLAPGACALLLLSPLSTTLNAQASGSVRSRADAREDARARIEERVRDIDGTARITRLLNGVALSQFDEPNAARIGVTTASGSGEKGDTLGVLVEAVTPQGPADKAGIKAGARITSINGVNLRVASQDADDPELLGIGQRRLLREMGKLKAGDEVELRVATGGSPQTYKIRTVTAEELSPSRTVSYGPGMERLGNVKRASLGVSVGSSGSVRDTLGIFVSAVSSKGPAETAGIVEGDRIAAINGVDVRVPREDAEDMQASSARVNRFMRELAKLNPGDKATLRVYSSGRYREVPVTTGSGDESMMRRFQFNSGDGVRTMMLPGLDTRGLMRLENLPGVIRSRGAGDSVRVLRRRTEPAGDRAVMRTVAPVRVRSISR